MEESHKKQVEEIIGGLKCPKDFKCYESGFKALCKAKGTAGTVTYLECLEDNSQCLFAVSMPEGDSNICSCPLRRYIAA